jgi:predicted RNA binding protein YcfA (HicA-like mRNA interferase family)
MTDLPRGITARELLRALHADGFRLTRTRGSHLMLRHADQELQT